MLKKKRLFIFIAIISIVLSIAASFEGADNVTEAGYFSCSGMGYGMINRRSVGNARTIKQDEGNRKWTVQELFLETIGYTSYNGEGESTWLWAEKVDRGLDRVGPARWNATGVQDNLLSSRTAGSCYFGNLTVISNGITHVASLISVFTGLFISITIGGDWYSNPIVQVVGGGVGGDGGLIETFRSSIYMPLVVIAFLFAVGTIVYKGLIQMKLREGLMAIIWSVLAFVVGLVLMFNPVMLAELPAKITSTISTCVVGAMSGTNCFTGDVTTPSTLTGQECRSEIVGGDNDIETMINSMNCTIWKTFVLEPWANHQFGEPYRNLYTDNVPEGGSLWSNLPEGEERTYCVNLASTRSINDSRPDNVVMDLEGDHTVCNVALYQLFLKTNMEDEVNHSDNTYQDRLTRTSDTEFDARWYDIIVPMATDNARWDNWSGSNGQRLVSIGTALLSLISVILASIIMFMLSLYAASYQVVGVVLMAFAPLFFLFAIEPTRGRKLFLGWLETFTSSMLKYFATALLAVVSLVMYAGVLQNTSHINSLIAVIILTFALWMYRKEIVDLIGASNMGGQRLSNKASSAMDWGKKQAKQKGAAYVGGRIGGRHAGRQNWEKKNEQINATLDELNARYEASEDEIEKKEIKSEIDVYEEMKDELGEKRDAGREAAKEGGRESVGRIMRRGTSMTAAAFRQSPMTKRNIEKKDKEDRDKRLEELEKEKDAIRDSYYAGEFDDENRETTKEEDSRSTEENSRSTNTPISNELKGGEQDNKRDFDGDLSPEEVKALNEFADKIEGLTDDELMNTASEEQTIIDPNKKKLVNDTINERIRRNTDEGISSGELSIHYGADLSNLVDEDVTANATHFRDKYIETNDKKDFDRLDETLDEHIKRGFIDKDTKTKYLSDTLEAAEIKYKSENEKNQMNEDNNANESDKGRSETGQNLDRNDEDIIKRNQDLNRSDETRSERNESENRSQKGQDSDINDRDRTKDDKDSNYNDKLDRKQDLDYSDRSDESSTDDNSTEQSGGTRLPNYDEDFMSNLNNDEGVIERSQGPNHNDKFERRQDSDNEERPDESFTNNDEVNYDNTEDGTGTKLPNYNKIFNDSMSDKDDEDN